MDAPLTRETAERPEAAEALGAPPQHPGTAPDGLGILPIGFGRAICGDLAQAERREWWVSNGLGGYAAGTVAGTLTRRYHGLLVAPVDPPLGRVLLLAKADATLEDGVRSWPLHSNRWADAIDPLGLQDIESFRLDGTVPVWVSAAGGVRLECRVWMEHGANTVYVAYRLLDRVAGLRLRLRLLVNARDHHGESAAGWFEPEIRAEGDRLHVIGPGCARLHIRVPGGRVVPEAVWVRDFDLAAERERGLPSRDNHLSVGEAEIGLVPGRWVGLIASVTPKADLAARVGPDFAVALARRRARDRSVLERASGVPAMQEAPGWVRRLVLTADSFLFARPLPDVPDGESVIAGFPWFGDWGRDTMISLPGLTLATGRPDSARRVLETFARFVDRGMLPNVFPGDGQAAEYNTADAALWYIEAWRAYVDATGDRQALARAFPVLRQIVDCYAEGTRYGIRRDPADGLLRAGEPGMQLTWMDAKVGDYVVTPRIGKPVEINALWYNALRIMAEFARRLGAPAEDDLRMADAARAGFRRFVRPDGAGLLDVLDGPAGDDAALRPNQIFAVSLPHSPLAAERQADVVAVCRRHLLTSYGLRSLAPEEPDYRPHYGGGVSERDSAYHQGPVWAWLLGHYALAEYRVTGDAAAAQARLEPIADHLMDAGLGSVSEIFDAAPPHLPRGAPSQAWSVACTLEAWWRLEQAKRQPKP